MRGFEEIFNIRDAREFYTRNKKSFLKEQDYFDFIKTVRELYEVAGFSDREYIDDFVLDMEVAFEVKFQKEYSCGKLRLKKVR